jgi:hypothetical protein
MKHKAFSLAVMLTLILSAMHTSYVSAQAYTTTFSTSITILNVSGSTAQYVVSLYSSPTTTSPITVSQPDLPAGAGTSLFVGSLSSVPAGFRGSAIIQANARLLATAVQVPQGSATVKNRPMSNGFEAGSSSAVIATFLKQRFDQNTIVAIQNTDTANNNVTVSIYDATNPSAPPVQVTQNDLAPGAAFYLDAGTLSSVPSNFSGSMTISAVRSSGGGNGSIVASAMELNIAGTGASAFESVGTGANTVYMPSAICNAFGGQNTAYAVQNTSLSTAASVTVTYSNGSVEGPITVNPGAKFSFQGCTVNSAGFSGSARITSTGAPIIAVGKVIGTGLSTAFVGATTGGRELALPYVRWSETQYSTGGRQRTFLAIQNVGSTDLAAGAVTVEYRDKTGAVVGTHSLAAIPAGGKVNSNPSNVGSAASELGYYSDGTFGAGAIVRGPSGSQLVVIARVQSVVPGVNTVGEDYNGLVITP